MSENFKSAYIYVEVALGSIQNRGHVMKLQEGIAAIKQAGDSPSFMTIHRFDESFRDYVTERKTVKGFTGASYTPWLPFDFDDAELEHSHSRAQQFIGELINGYGAPRDQILVYFSGRKGYHVYLPSAFFGDWSPSDTLHKRLRTLALRLGDDYNIDPAIYDQRRLLRHPMTRHDATNLYKRRIPTADFLAASVEEVTDMAILPGDNAGIVPSHECDEVPSLAAIWLDTHDKRAAPKVLSPDRQTLAGSFPLDLKEGDGRDNQVYWKARQLREWGVPAYEANNILQLWDAQMETPLTKTDGGNILWDKVRSAYGADADLDAEEGVQVYNGREALNEYQSYLDNPGAQVPCGYDEIDEMHRHIRSGEVVVILGKTGSGKTAFALNMLRHMAKGDFKTLFFSLEMTLPRVIERQCAIESGVSAAKIEADFSTIHRHDLTSLPWWDNYHICAQPAMSMAQIEETIQRTSDYSGKVDVVCIDYLGLIKVSGNNSSVSNYQAVSEVAASLKAVSKRCDCAIIILAQISRSHGEAGDVLINLSSGRDSGVIEEGADLVLGIHRPELSAQDRVMGVQVLKSRKGKINAAGQFIAYAWNGPSFYVQPGELDIPWSEKDSLVVPRNEPPPPAPTKTPKEKADLFSTITDEDVLWLNAGSRDKEVK